MKYKHIFFNISLLILLPLTKAATAKDIAMSYPIKGVDVIDISGKAEVDFIQSDSEYLRIDADEEFFTKIKVDKTDNKLSIYQEKISGNFMNWINEDNNKKKIRVTLHLKDIKKLELSGMVNMNAADIKTDELNLNLSGAVNIKLNSLAARNFLLNISGAANVEILSPSETDKLVIDASGAGHVMAKKLQTKIAELDLSGASHIDISVSEKLIVDASGVSAVSYHGNPEVKKNVSGISKVDAAD